jgi:hypothetical protein
LTTPSTAEIRVFVDTTQAVLHPLKVATELLGNPQVFKWFSGNVTSGYQNTPFVVTVFGRFCYVAIPAHNHDVIGATNPGTCRLGV